MPLSAAAAAAAGVEPTAHGNVSESAVHLRVLGDVFAISRRLPFANAFSIGDVLIACGIIAFVTLVAVGENERVLDPARLLQPLRSDLYRRLLAGKLVSFLGDWLTLAAVVGWVYEGTRSTGTVALVMLARLAPPILGGGVAGVVVDRLPKGRLLVWIEAARGVVVVVALVGVATAIVPLVLAALAVSGGLAALSAAGTSAIVPNLLPEDELSAANAALAMAKDVAMALGAAGAGLALASVGAAPALGVDAASFVVAAVLLGGLRVTGTPPESSHKSDEGLLSGLRYILRRRRLLVLAASFAVATVATGLANASLPRFLAGPHGLGASGYGFGIAALAVGLTLGEALVGVVRVGPEGPRWIGVALLLMGGLFVFLATTSHGPTALLVLAAIGFVDGTTEVLYSTAVQQEAEPERQGAAFGFSSALMTTTMMGAFAAAPLANALVRPAGVMLGASVFLVVAGVVALGGMRGATHTTVVPSAA
jgi:predicted MFS family arabinose efflux permease